MRVVGKIAMLIFNDTEEKAVEKAIAALADMIPLEAIQPPHSPALIFPGLEIRLHQRQVLKNGTDVSLTRLELERVSPVPIRYEEMEGDRKGYFIDLSRPIAIKEGMSEAQTAKTGVHEVAHAKLHAREAEQDAEKQFIKTGKRKRWKPYTQHSKMLIILKNAEK